MPPQNNFRHQVYTADAPPVPPEVLALPPPPTDRGEFLARMADVGERYRTSGVQAIYLVHGTFMGNDALDLARMIGHVAPAVGEWARRNQKALVDSVAGDSANFTGAYGTELEESLAGSGVRIPVRLFLWSSQNHHVGRADAALRLFEELNLCEAVGKRLLLWGHSHAGNVFALLTNLLGADAEHRGRFFDAMRPFYGRGTAGDEMLRRIEHSFSTQPRPLTDVSLDLVTFGTPIRYGWDASGYARLLHFIHHRAHPSRAEYLARFPIVLDDLLSMAGGDYIQQIGIAGTNFALHPFAWRAWRAEASLNKLLQPGLRRRDLASRLAIGMRVPSEGQTLLVDYGQQGKNIARHVAGHAVYTRRELMLFHAEEIARRFYQDARKCE